DGPYLSDCFAYLGVHGHICPGIIGQAVVRRISRCRGQSFLSGYIQGIVKMTSTAVRVVCQVEKAPVAGHERFLEQFITVGGLYIKEAVSHPCLKVGEGHEPQLRLQAIRIRAAIEVIKDQLAWIFVVDHHLVGEIVPEKFSTEGCFPIEHTERLVEADTRIPGNLRLESIRIFRCMGGSDADGARPGQGRSVLGKNVGCPLPAAATYAKAGSRYGLIAQVYARRGKPAVEVVVIAADTRDRIKFVRWAIGVFEERAR